MRVAATTAKMVNESNQVKHEIAKAEAEIDYGYGDDVTDYGYSTIDENKSTPNIPARAEDYGYGDYHNASVALPAPQVAVENAVSSRKRKQPHGMLQQHHPPAEDSHRPPRQQKQQQRYRAVRRNSFVIRNNLQNRGMAEFLLSLGPPPRSDRDMEAVRLEQQQQKVQHASQAAQQQQHDHPMSKSAYQCSSASNAGMKLTDLLRPARLGPHHDSFRGMPNSSTTPASRLQQSPPKRLIAQALLLGNAAAADQHPNIESLLASARSDDDEDDNEEEERQDRASEPHPQSVSSSGRAK
ncbi:hypothetical protein ACA910_008048 [Epithemia clementina (nom. ined.)]